MLWIFLSLFEMGCGKRILSFFLVSGDCKQLFFVTGVHVIDGQGSLACTFLNVISIMQCLFCGQ